MPRPPLPPQLACSPALNFPCAAQIATELIEMRELDTARALLRGADAFTAMRMEEPERCVLPLLL